MQVLNNPARFSDPFQFEIEFQSLEALDDCLEFRVVYVGSSETKDFDQTIEEVEVGPVAAGTMKFVLQCDAADLSKVPHEEAIGVTAILVCCLYKQNEFARIGYYVNNEYDAEHQEWNVDLPSKHVPEFIVRNILTDKPRLTVFKIPHW